MATAEYDLKIVGGDIYDGSGGPAWRGDIGVTAGKIVAVGEARGSARQTVDARGLAVAPGFIDIHTHYDAQIIWDRMLTISPWHGVTTVVLGNCGFGVAPTRPDHRDLILRTLETVEGMSLKALQTGLGTEWGFETFPEYLDAIEQRGSAINVGVLVGHTPVRLYVMGEEAAEREASTDEIAQMRGIVASALDAGALGFATSKQEQHTGFADKPVPSRLASAREIGALASTLKDAGHGVMQVTAGHAFFLDELEGLARNIERPITWTALLTGHKNANVDHHTALARSQALCDSGLIVIPQVTPRPVVIEFQFSHPSPMATLPCMKPVFYADADGKRIIYADPAFRKAFKDEAGAIAGGAYSLRWDQTSISLCASEPALEGRDLSTVAAERGLHPVDLALDLALATDLEARFRMAILNNVEDEVGDLITARHTVLGLSDAGAHAAHICDGCQATYLLGHWVRELGTIALERAIWMLTARAAEVFGITDRGRLAAGLAADITIFDPETVGAGALRRVNDFPAGQDRLVSDASGIDTVIVNGVVIRQRNDDMVDAGGPLPGQLLRHGRAAA